MELDGWITAPAGVGRHDPAFAPPARLGRRTRAALFLGVLVIAGYSGAWLLDGGQGGFESTLSLGLPAVAAVVAWGVRGAPGVARREWTLLAGGLTLWAGAGVYVQPAGAAILPGGAAGGDLLALATAGLWIAALLPRRPRLAPLLNSARLLDFTLALVAALTLASYFVLEPLALAGGLSPLVLHALGSLALFGALAGRRYLAPGPLPAGQALTLLGLVAALLGDGWHLGIAGGAPVAPEPVAGALRIAATIAILAAAYRTVHAGPAGRPVDRWSPFASWLPSGYLSAVIALPVLASTGRPLGPAILAGVLVCIGLTTVRLGASLGENHRLRQERAHLLWQRQEYARLAISDALTGLFNKGYFAHRLHTEVERSTRYGHPLTVIALDLDNFKQVNDRYGHAAGDALLRDIGAALRAGSRAGDIPCRCGGDEFSLLLPETSADAGLLIAERIRVAVAAVLHRHGHRGLVGASAGVAEYPRLAHDGADLLRQADAALYEAKQAGKNRVVLGRPRSVTVPVAPAPPVYPTEGYLGDTVQEYYIQ